MSTLNVSNLTGPSNTGTAAVLSSLNGGPLSGTRNRIINGDMRIDQRNAGAAFTPTTDGQYGGPDRWTYWLSQPSKYSVQQSTAAPTGFSSSLLITSLSSYAVTGNDYFAVLQKIEGFNFADMMWGTANAQPVTLSFWVRSSLTGTFGGAMTNGATNRSYPFSYTISEANTWEQKSVIIAGDTSGTWVGATNGVGAMAQFSLGAVSARLGTAGTWVGDWVVGSTGSTSIVATNGATFYITGVQLEAGTVATPFERRSYGQELMLAQRYCQVIPAFRSSSFDAYVSYYGGTLAVRPDSILPVEMRAAPTGAIANSSVQYYSFGGVWTNTTLFLGSSTSKTFYIYAASDGDGRTKLMRNGSSGLGPDPILTCFAEL